MQDATAPTCAGTFSDRWITVPSVEHHAIVFEMLHGKGLLYLEDLLAFMLEIETGATFKPIRKAA